MVRESTAKPQQDIQDESPDFLGRPYNLSLWKPTRAEHENFRANGPKVGDMAPDFTLPSLDGGEVTLSSMRGMPAVIEFGSMT